jgi:hypothetical protein
MYPARSMKKIDSNISCPSCFGPLRPSLLTCDCCSLKIEGQFKQNEFAGLGSDDLDFLRLFISAEGRIRDLEKHLGVSYPTIKAKIAHLKKLVIPTPPISKRSIIGATACRTEKESLQ